MKPLKQPKRPLKDHVELDFLLETDVFHISEREINCFQNSSLIKLHVQTICIKYDKLICYKIYISRYIEKCSKMYLLNVNSDRLREIFTVFYILLFLLFQYYYKNIYYHAFAIFIIRTTKHWLLMNSGSFCVVGFRRGQSTST